jgi:hypothetical protein
MNHNSYAGYSERRNGHHLAQQQAWILLKLL